MSGTVPSLLQIAVGVESLERSLARYCEGLGLEVLWRGSVEAEAARSLWGLDTGPPAATLGRRAVAGSPTLRLVECGGPAARAPRDTMSGGPLGIGFTSSGIHTVFDRLAAAGVAFQSSTPVQLTPDPEGPTGPRRLEAFGQTPDGEFIVLIERQNVPTPYGTISERWQTSEPLHTSHVVADLAAARDFMESGLSQQVIFRERCAEPETDELMGLPAGTAFRFEMLSADSSATGRIIFIEYEEQAPAAAWAEPPRLGIHALAYACRDLDGQLARVADAGGRLLRPPAAVDSPGLPRGRGAPVASPLGVLLELWELA